MTEATSAAGMSPSPFAGSDWFDPLEEAVRLQVRSFIEELLEEELEAADGGFPPTAVRGSLWPLHDGARYQRAGGCRVAGPGRIARKRCANFALV